MRKLLLVMLCLALAGTSFAKPKFGVKGGLTYSDFRAVDVQDDWEGVFNSSNSWNAGVFAQVKVLGVALQQELLYSQKGTEVLKMKYLDLPLSLRFDLTGIPKVLTPYIIGGPFVSYAIDGELDGANFDYKKFDYGVGIGIGCDFFKSLQFTARYDWGLGKVAEDGYPVNAKSRVFSLSLGIYL